ncbi:1,4-alpha-glucan branching protein GlgB [Fundidesulfovibrio soli]|uniref:1,4-alpha-glucan branching protein GlgB n=1 Tax=Fundidesulfovibrio soli TaxID=2922716 RepID=UPI001FAF82C7|nr:1,4-alpha-glucan branching protein GlgB [Fundidesulfovibrio soli]
MSTPVAIPPFDLYLFGRGEHWDIYRILGAHPHREGGRDGFRFAVWAPNAREVCVLGDWNGWRFGETMLHPVAASGIWAGFVPGVERGQLYKFAVRDASGQVRQKSDPYAFRAELRPATASVAWGLGGYDWQDQEWMQARAGAGLPLDRPVCVYEVHPGSWRWSGPNYGDFLDYGRLADELIPYVADLGFTHIQLMPMAEHPLDESWGYQTGHYFAPTSRHGTPEGFKHFIDRCHQSGLAVLLDWVPGHFPKDAWCLGRFDGTSLYEHEDPRKGEHPDWGTYIFNYSRNEVRNFLLANALYWLEEFHLDGLRIDAVASMLYLDYSREDGQWAPNEHGGKENLEAIAFLRELNTVVHARYPGALMAAEESTAWAGVSRPVSHGGLGFSFKWNMGWMNDTLEYFSKDPLFRRHHQNTLTFSMLYAFHENFILPMSHDEVTHGKGSLISKMPGDEWQRFANLRCFFSYMWAHPGKKLMFMGGEFGQWREWTSREPLDWALLDFPAHQGLMAALRDLNGIVRREPAMHALDCEWGGFEWVDLSDSASSVISFLRKDGRGAQILCVFNFTPVVRRDYALGSRHPGRWREIFNSDAACYGGSGVGNAGGVDAESPGLGLWPHQVRLTLPPLGAVFFKAEEPSADASHDPDDPGRPQRPGA